MNSFARSVEKITGCVDLLFVANEGDTVEIDSLQQAKAHHLVVPDSRVSWSKKINDAMAMYQRTYDWFVCSADDVSYPLGWYETVAPILDTSRNLVVGTNHDHSGEEPFGSLHPIVHCDYYRLGTFDEPLMVSGVMHEGYRHWCPDTELAETAMLRGLYKHCKECVLYHRKEPWDPTYELGRASVKADRRLFLHRMYKLFAMYNAPERMARWEHLKPLCDWPDDGTLNT